METHPWETDIYEEELNKFSKEHKNKTGIVSHLLVLSNLLLVTPLGVVFMWLLTRWPLWLKTVITLFVIIVPLSLVIFVVKSTTTPQQQTESIGCVLSCNTVDGTEACLRECVNKYSYK